MKNNKYFNLWVAALILFFGIIVPFCLNWTLMSGKFPTAEGLETADWLGFWGSYLAGAIGIIVTLVSFMFTYIQNERQHKITQDEMLEERRLQILPYLSISFECLSLREFNGDDKTEYIDFSNLPDQFGIRNGKLNKNATFIDICKNNNPFLNSPYFLTVKIKNIGNSAAIDCRFTAEHSERYAALQNIPKDESVSIYFLFPITPKTYNIEFIMDDLHGRHYSQSFEYQILTSSFSEIGYRATLLSAPTQISTQ